MDAKPAEGARIGQHGSTPLFLPHPHPLSLPDRLSQQSKLGKMLLPFEAWRVRTPGREYNGIECRIATSSTKNSRQHAASHTLQSIHSRASPCHACA